MAKVPYTIDVDRYVCSELEDIRKMINNLDFSRLAAVVERVQYHASAMENALYRYNDIKYDLMEIVDKEDLSDEEFRKKAREILGELKR